jgi:hypothetical protein
MSDISNQLIKDSYNYVLQSDLSTGIVYRIGGGIPVNPKFLSGLTINSGFTYSNGTEQPGYVLITDAFGNANWGPISGSSNGNYLSLSGGTVTGETIFTSGVTANTISATTYQNLPPTPFLPLSGGTVTGDTNFTSGLTGTSIVVNSFNYTWAGPVVGSIFSYFNDTIYVNETGKTHYFGGGPGNVQNNLSVPNGTLYGSSIIGGGVTANTISATTYYNLPVSGVTGGTGISASTSDGLVTIVNTSPDQVVTISGDTGISTGGTYPNFVLTNTAPDQVVTISGGTNISVNGTYPNFGINFTGSTGASGDFLPLSGGTVTGGTTFTSGLTANTISATTYQGINRSFGVSFDGMGSVILVNSQTTLTIPYNMIIQSWVLLSDVTGSTVIDIWKDTYDNYPPTSGDSITALAKPSISSDTRNQSSTLTGWNTIVNSGDIIRFNVDSCTGMTRAQLTIIGKEF